MKSTSTPKIINTNPPVFSRPLGEQMSQFRGSFPSRSGLCNQSSFSTSSGNNSKPADGCMLYFSDTVWVLMPSSLPSRDGGRKSSKGEPDGSNRLSRLPSELQLDRRDNDALPA